MERTIAIAWLTIIAALLVAGGALLWRIKSAQWKREMAIAIAGALGAGAAIGGTMWAISVLLLYPAHG